MDAICNDLRLPIIRDLRAAIVDAAQPIFRPFPFGCVCLSLFFLPSRVENSTITTAVRGGTVFSKTDPTRALMIVWLPQPAVMCSNT